MDNYGYRLVESVSDSVHNLVYNSFLKSLRRSPPYNLVPNRLFFDKFHDVLESWLRTGRLVLAVSLEDADIVYGWALGSATELHYAYVKQLHRGFGIASDMVKELLFHGQEPPDAVQDAAYSVLTEAGQKFLDFVETQGGVRFKYSVPGSLRDRQSDGNGLLDQPVKSTNSLKAKTTDAEATGAKAAS